MSDVRIVPLRRLVPGIVVIFTGILFVQSAEPARRQTAGGAVAAQPVSTPLRLEGAWRLTSYVKAENKVRYKTEGYMMFTRTHWMHIAYFNRDERERDFSEAHHGTYKITGPDTAVLIQDIELHMDPKMEFQKAPVFYGPAGGVVDARYRVQGDTVVMDFKSGAQIVIERIE